MTCSYCYHASPETLPFKVGLMPLDTAKKIIRASAAAGVHSLKFNWKGESTLHPDYDKITQCARNYRKGSTFIELLANSNFNFNKQDNIFRGLSNLTKVKISYDSTIKHIFEKQRPGGIHELVTTNIDAFYNCKHRRKTNTEMVIQAVRTELNKDEDLEHLIKKRWPETTISIRDVVAGRNDDEKGFKNRDFLNRQSCIQAHARLIFNWQGKAYPCCPDIKERLYLGSIHEKNIYEIFNSKQALNLRKRLKDKRMFEFDPCRNCSSYESYKGYKPVFKS
jgi:radical SAM protein with 4Fe4S-binding SPASM domain